MSVNGTFNGFIIGLFIGLFLTSLMLIIEPLEFDEKSKTFVDCYDKYGNQIIGETCLNQNKWTKNDYKIERVGQGLVIILFSGLIGTMIGTLFNTPWKLGDPI